MSPTGSSGSDSRHGRWSVSPNCAEWDDLTIRLLECLLTITTHSFQHYSYVTRTTCTLIMLYFATHTHDVPAFSRPAFSTPGILVLRFPVLRFPPMRFGPAFSSPAFSSHAIWSHVFQSRVFSRPDQILKNHSSMWASLNCRNYV